MDAPAQTLNYMIAGYVVIFGVILGYIASILLRWMRLRKEQDHLHDLLDED